MSPPADEPNFEVSQQNFTVLLSIGPPAPETGFPESERDGQRSDDDPEQNLDDRPERGRHWIWQQSICAVLHAIFVRGGSVTARADGELLALLWGVASTHSSNGPGEVSGPRIHILRDLDQADADGESSPFSAAFEETGLVEVHGRANDDNELPGPSPHFGMVLWPDESSRTDQPLFSRTSANAVVRWNDQQAFDVPDQRDVIMEGDAPAVAFLLESVVEEWTGRSRG